MYYWSNWTERYDLQVHHIFWIYPDHLLDTKQKPDCKIQITAKKTFDLRYFTNIFSLIDNVSNTDYPILW